MPFLRLPRVGDDTENGAVKIEEISQPRRSGDQSSSLVEPKWSLGVIVVLFYPKAIYSPGENNTSSRIPRNIAVRNAARIAVRLERKLDLVSVKKREQRVLPLL